MILFIAVVLYALDTSFTRSTNYAEWTVWAVLIAALQVWKLARQVRHD